MALMTGTIPWAAWDARPSALAKRISSGGGASPSSAAVRTSSSTSSIIRFRSGRPSEEAALRAGSERRSASTEGTFRRTSTAIATGAYRLG